MKIARLRLSPASVNEVLTVARRGVVGPIGEGGVLTDSRSEGKCMGDMTALRIRTIFTICR